MHGTIGKLTEIFTKFPGIGPRQARRFVYYLLHNDQARLEYLADLITKLKREIHLCQSCFRYFTGNAREFCELCSDPNKDRSQLLIIASDADLESIEKSDSYDGMYFVLGGIISIIEKSTGSLVRIQELALRVKKDADAGILKEIIFALAANPEGDYTVQYLKRTLEPLIEGKGIGFTILGRGLSTGTELEYSDADTIKNALKNRS